MKRNGKELSWFERVINSRTTAYKDFINELKSVPSELFFRYGEKENLVAASGLPEGWIWYDYDDGSGSLRSPEGHSYYSYDLQTQEYRSPYGNNEWKNMGILKVWTNLKAILKKP